VFASKPAAVKHNKNQQQTIQQEHKDNVSVYMYVRMNCSIHHIDGTEVAQGWEQLLVSGYDVSARANAELRK
jgi:hypothetical protein